MVMVICVDSSLRLELGLKYCNRVSFWVIICVSISEQ